MSYQLYRSFLRCRWPVRSPIAHLYQATTKSSILTAHIDSITAQSILKILLQVPSTIPINPTELSLTHRAIPPIQQF